MTARYRWGDTKPSYLPLKSGVAVAIPDLCFRDTGDSDTIKPASSYTWVSAVAAPSAPTVTNAGVNIGTGLTNALTGVKVSYQFPWGEGTLSAAGTATPTANAALKVAAIALPSPALWINYYVEDSAGSGTYLLAATGNGQAMYISTYGGGAAPSASSAGQGATTQTQYGFAQAFVGCAAQRYDGTTAGLLAYGIKDGYLRFDTDGVFEFDIASASFSPGDYLAPAKASGNALENQLVIAVPHRTLAVAKVIKPGSSATKVLASLFQQKMAFSN